MSIPAESYALNTLESVSEDLPQRVAGYTSEILLVTDAEAEAKQIAGHLATAGYKVNIAVYDGENIKKTPKAPPLAILCHFKDFIERIPVIFVALKEYYSPKTPPIIAALSRPGNIDKSIFDSVIFYPAHPSQIAARVDFLVRLQAMEREINLRIETLSEDFEITHALQEDTLRAPYQILFIGKATPEFMVVINALQKRNVEVVAAFTSFSAFDYLHQRTFDAVVMNALEGMDSALTIGDVMRRNSRLYHVPTFLLIDDNSDYHDQAYKKGAHDIITPQNSEDEIAGRVLELANYHRIHSQLKREYETIGGDRCLDMASKTFNNPFFSAHLARAHKHHTLAGTSLSIVGIHLFPDRRATHSPDKVRHAMDKVGEILKNMVRMQDAVARMHHDLYMISFPEMPLIHAQKVIDRVTDIISHTAFDPGIQGLPPLSMHLATAQTDIKNHDSSDSMIQQLVSELSQNTHRNTPE